MRGKHALPARPSLVIDRQALLLPADWGLGVGCRCLNPARPRQDQVLAHLSLQAPRMTPWPTWTSHLRLGFLAGPCAFAHSSPITEITSPLPPPLTWFFASLGRSMSLDLWGGILLCCGDGPAHSRMLSSIPAFYPVEARCTSPGVTAPNVSDTAQCRLGWGRWG